MIDIASKIEAILFYKAEPVSRKRLSEMLACPSDEIDAGISELSDKLKNTGGGVCLMENAESVMLATAPEASALIQGIVKEELSRDMGKAASETLAIVLYLGSIARSRIDWIRGVNSTFILRNLMIRGLVERITNPSDERSFLYRPTFDLLGHLGVACVEDIPDYEMVRAEIARFENENAGPAVEGSGGHDTEDTLETAHT